MEFICLDKDYQNPVWLRPLNVQWNAKQYENGDFSIQIQTSDYEPFFCYVYCNEREQMGLVQKIYQQNTLKGHFTQISGFFLERLLHDYVVSETVSCTDMNICEYAAGIIQKFVDQDDFIIDDYSCFTDTITSQITEGYLDDVLYELLKLRRITFRIYYDFVANQLHLKFVRGKNRTQAQGENNAVIFSEELKNLQNVEYNGDASNYRNYAFVRGGDGDETTEPTTVIVDRRLPGERRREMVVNAGDIRKEDDADQNDFKAQLVERGNTELAQYADIKNIACDVESDLIKYREDYDLGDVVDIVVAGMYSAYESEIIEVDEVLKSNQHTITLILGEKIPVKYGRRR